MTSIFFDRRVVSGIEKRISGTEPGRLLKDRGLSVFLKKWTRISMWTRERSARISTGVFVTKDGGETDLDLGQ